MKRIKKTERTSKAWTPEEVELLESFGRAQPHTIAHLFPGRTYKAIAAKQSGLGLREPKEPTRRSDPRRPITEETAYQVRVDYAAKRKLGYTHGQALDWLERAHNRDPVILLDLLTNPEHYAAAKRYLQNIRGEPDANGNGDFIY